MAHRVSTASSSFPPQGQETTLRIHVHLPEEDPADVEVTVNHLVCRTPQDQVDQIIPLLAQGGLQFLGEDRERFLTGIKNTITFEKAKKGIRELKPHIDRLELQDLLGLNITGAYLVSLILTSYLLKFLNHPSCNKTDPTMQQSLLNFAALAFFGEPICDQLPAIVKGILPVNKWNSELKADFIAMLKVLHILNDHPQLHNSILQLEPTNQEIPPSSIPKFQEFYSLVQEAATAQRGRCLSLCQEIREGYDIISLRDLENPPERKVLTKLLTQREQTKHLLQKLPSYLQMLQRLRGKILYLHDAKKTDAAVRLIELSKKLIKQLDNNLTTLLAAPFFVAGHLNCPSIKSILSKYHLQNHFNRYAVIDELTLDISSIMFQTMITEQSNAVVLPEDLEPFFDLFAHYLSHAFTVSKENDLPPLPSNPYNASCYSAINVFLKTHIPKKLKEQLEKENDLLNEISVFLIADGNTLKDHRIEKMMHLLRDVALPSLKQGFSYIANKTVATTWETLFRDIEIIKTHLLTSFFKDEKTVKKFLETILQTPPLSYPQESEEYGRALITAKINKEIIEAFQEQASSLILPLSLLILREKASSDNVDNEMEAQAFLEELEAEICFKERIDASLPRIQEVDGDEEQEIEETDVVAPAPKERAPDVVTPFYSYLTSLESLASLSSRPSKSHQHTVQAVYHFQLCQSFLQWAHLNPNVHKALGTAFVNSAHLAVEQRASALAPYKYSTTHLLPNRLRELGFSDEMASEAGAVNPRGTFLARYPRFRTMVNHDLAAQYLARASEQKIDECIELSKKLFNRTFNLLAALDDKIPKSALESFDATALTLQTREITFVEINADAFQEYELGLRTLFSQATSPRTRMLLKDLGLTLELLMEPRQIPRECYDLLLRHIHRTFESLIVSLLEELSTGGSIETLLENISIQYLGVTDTDFTAMEAQVRAFILRKRNDYPIEFKEQTLIEEHIAANSPEGFYTAGATRVLVTNEQIRENIENLLKTGIELLSSVFKLSSELKKPK